MKTMKLGDVCESISRGISPKYTEKKDAIAVLNQRCIRGNQLLFEFSRLHDITARKINESKILKVDDLLINSTGHGTLGRTALVEKLDHTTTVDSHITILRPKPGVFEPRYFAYIIGRCEDDFINMATGTSGQTELPRALLSEYEIVYNPSLEEQRRVVERLDTAFEKIDRAIMLTEENESNQSALQKSYLTRSFSTFKGTVKLGKVCKVGSSKRVLKSQWKNEGVPFYRGREISRLSKTGNAANELYIGKPLYEEYKDKFGVPAENDIMITAIGTIGNTYVVKKSDEFYFKDASVLWIRKSKDINSQFLNYWFKSERFINQLENNGTTVNTLTIGKLESFDVPLPSPEEQQRVVEQLDTAFEKINRANILRKTKFNSLSELKQSMLKQAFSGDGVQ